ncbi:MAG TPA: hypothetical protein PK047_10250 [Saprospiraceae bacterium]|nr:hypothetical protein [Saprospiraceae bacterium]HRO09238.1 hypothetical protein [Saprospiraceae bacterium]HRP42600.1 hypothetical protein [Saprospiraceae bacterium]
MRIFMFVIIFFAGGILQAQIGPAPQKNAPKEVKTEQAKKKTPMERAYNTADAMKNSLKLNDKQHKDLRIAFLNYEMKMDKLNKQKGLTLKELAVKKRIVNTERQENMKKIFTPEQYKRYQLTSPGG